MIILSLITFSVGATCVIMLIVWILKLFFS